MDDVKRALRVLPDPDPRGERRILRRFARTRAERRQRWVKGVSVLAIGAALAMLALVLWPKPPRTLAVASPSGTVQRVLWSDAVDLGVGGQGEVTGTEDEVVVRWQSGQLDVSVDPGAGVRLAVDAEEGRVEVTGTAFTVVRDALGLTTAVARGSVRVSCADGTGYTLVSTSEPATCWPRSSARLLGRADALEDRGRPPSEVRATLDRALGDADGPVRGELLVRRMRVLAALGEADAALDDARAYAADFETRAPEVHRFAAALAIEARQDCARALPHLDHLTDEPDFRWLRAACLARGDDRSLAALRTDHEDATTSERVRRWSDLLRASR